MKTITNEIKAKYFAQYLGSDVIKDRHINSDNFKLIGVNIYNITLIKDYERTGQSYSINDAILKLTSLENISDEDAIELFNLMFNKQHLDKPNEFKLELGKSWVSSYLRNKDTFAPFNYIYGFQYLQSKGYALPYLDYSVTDLQSLNVIKLKK